MMDWVKEHGGVIGSVVAGIAACVGGITIHFGSKKKTAFQHLTDGFNHQFGQLRDDLRSVRDEMRTDNARREVVEERMVSGLADLNGKVGIIGSRLDGLEIQHQQFDARLNRKQEQLSHIIQEIGALQGRSNSI